MQLAKLSLLPIFAGTEIDFEPMSNQNRLTQFQEDNLGIPVDERKSTSVHLRPGSSTAKRRCTTKVQLPYRPAAIDGVTQSLKMIEAITTYNVPVDAATADIAEVVYLNGELGRNAIVADIIENGRAPV